ncbi:hypothetical protein BH09PAT1_BH09PAT1_3150 [soil metagenome]
MQYRHVILGGTFDHFHIGHETMLKKAFEIGDKVSIGITTSEMFQDKQLSESIQDFDIRKNVVYKFIETNNWTERATILPIKDKYGSTLSDPTVEAIVVSPETEKIAQSIIPEREAKRLPKMDIVLVPFVMSDDGQPVSSQRIRQGLINRDGFSYLTFFLSKQNYTLPHSLREELQIPIGEIYTDVNGLLPRLTQNRILISVGDIVSTTLLDAGVKPTLCIVDFRTRREALDDTTISKHYSHVDQTLTNPHGTINPEIANVIQSVIASEAKQSHTIIKVDGEEDLLTLPAILLAPLGSIVIYGQYDLGMIVVEVTEEKKELIKSLLAQFSE